MAGGLVEGAALGTAFDQLLKLSKSVVDGTRKVGRFSSDKNLLESTLSSIELAIGEIASINKRLNRPPHETEEFTNQLEKGKELITKCSKVKKWNVIMRYYYSKKLSKFQALLVNFFQIKVPVLQFRETMRISEELSNLKEQMNELTEKMKEMTTLLEELSNLKEQMNELTEKMKEMTTILLNISRVASSEIVVELEQSRKGMVLIEEGGSH